MKGVTECELPSAQDLELWKREGIPELDRRLKLARENIRALQLENKKRYDAKRKEVKYEIGDKVMVKTKAKTDMEKYIHH